VKRRDFIGLAAGSAAAWPVLTHAQQPGKIPRIGYLIGGADASRANMEAFRAGLRQLGHVEGRTFTLELADTQGRFDKLPELAAHLVRQNVDLIMAGNTPFARAARNATSTIPIVAFALGDPGGDGLVTSLSQPGGNVTGLTFLGPELTAKRLQLLKDTLPALSRVAALVDTGSFSQQTTEETMRATETAARSLGLQIEIREARTSEQIEAAFAALVQRRPEAVLVFPSPFYYSHQQRIAELSLQQKLPSIYNGREFTELGGFMAYGANFQDLARRSASYVDRILKGAKPADLPVEQPTKFELLVNLKTAKQIGLIIPPHVLARADRIIR